MKLFEEKPVIEIKILRPDIYETPPEYKTEGAAAVDLRACNAAPVSVHPGLNVLIPTGIAISINDKNIVGILSGRSGIALKNNVSAGNGIGVIDSDYHGEIGLIASNTGNSSYVIHPGERVAQLQFIPVLQVEWKQVSEFSVATDRGENGFGSTGKL